MTISDDNTEGMFASKVKERPLSGADEFGNKVDLNNNREYLAGTDLKNFYYSDPFSSIPTSSTSTSNPFGALGVFILVLLIGICVFYKTLLAILLLLFTLLLSLLIFLIPYIIINKTTKFLIDTNSQLVSIILFGFYIFFWYQFCSNYPNVATSWILSYWNFLVQVIIHPLGSLIDFLP